MIELEGHKTFAVPAATLWAKLSDMRFLVDCIPDVGQIKAVGDQSAELVLRPSLGFVKGELQLSINVSEQVPPSSSTLLLKTKGIGTTSEVLATFTLQDASPATDLHWRAAVMQLGGLLKAVPKGLIQAAAQKTINDLLNNLDKKLK